MSPSFRYRKPGYVALDVTDLERSVRFYRDLVGLHLEHREGDEVAFLRCSDDHHNVVLYRAEVPGIRRMAFEMESEHDLDQLVAHVRAQGWPLTEVPASETTALHQGRTWRFRIPASTLTFEVYAHMDRAQGDYVPTVSQIQRLGHVVIRCADRDAVLHTLTEQLNFKVSDHFGNQVAFLRCFPNPFHHTFGVSRGEADGLHHVNFMVTNVDDVGRAMNRMRQAGVNVVYGPGRHDISNSIFLYFLDPDGLTTEYSFGMEEFAEQGAREPRQLPMKPEILDAWGGLPQPGFGSTGVIAPSTF
jgi:2,3-dihydroxy-p-cumate/2,3-dihydroxybenzoate 3,4-dioxygenase